MYHDKLRYYSLNHDIEACLIPDTYYVLKRSRLVKKVIQLLIKWKWILPYRINKFICEAHEIILENLIELVYRQINQQLEAGSHPTMVIIGREQMATLDMQLANEQTIIPFTVKYDQGGNKMFMGLNLILHPFIDGVVVI